MWEMQVTGVRVVDLFWQVKVDGTLAIVVVVGRTSERKPTSSGSLFAKGSAELSANHRLAKQNSFDQRQDDGSGRGRMNSVHSVSGPDRGRTPGGGSPGGRRNPPRTSHSQQATAVAVRRPIILQS